MVKIILSESEEHIIKIPDTLNIEQLNFYINRLQKIEKSALKDEVLTQTNIQTEKQKIRFSYKNATREQMIELLKIYYTTTGIEREGLLEKKGTTISSLSTRVKEFKESFNILPNELGIESYPSYKK